MEDQMRTRPRLRPVDPTGGTGRKPRASALYEGVFEIAQFKPGRRRASRRMFALYLDLDEMADLDRRLRLFSAGRFNLTGFDPARHGAPHPGGRSALSLKASIEARLAAKGLATGGPMRVLAAPRLLGRSLALPTIFLCHAADGRLSALVCEEFGQAGAGRTGVIAVGPDFDGMVRRDWPGPDGGPAGAFRLKLPGETLVAGLELSDEKDLVASASLLARRAELSDLALLKAWLTHLPMMFAPSAAGAWDRLRARRSGGPRPAAAADDAASSDKLAA